MEINGWKWHHEEICTEIEQLRWETNSMDRVLTNTRQHKQWPSVCHWTLKPRTPSKQCQAVCPFTPWQWTTLLPFPAHPPAQPARWAPSTSAHGARLHFALLLCNCTTWILCCLFLGLGLKIVQVQQKGVLFWNAVWAQGKFKWLKEPQVPVFAFRRSSFFRIGRAVI